MGVNVYKLNEIEIGDISAACRRAKTMGYSFAPADAATHARLLQIGFTWMEDVTPEPPPEPTTEQLIEAATSNRLVAYQCRSDCKYMEYQYALNYKTDPAFVETTRLAFLEANPLTGEADHEAWLIETAADIEAKRLDWMAEVAAIKEEFAIEGLEFIRL